MLEYLEMFYGLRRAGKALTKMGVVDFATTIAPGFRDVLVTGKTSEAVRAQGQGRQAGLRRGRARRAADRPDHPLPQRHQRGRRPGQGRARSRTTPTWCTAS